ncbi:MAG TPA: hypothetical protein VK982_11850 [Bacteroidales bacterium]|nr:hypothetical protein [Bacteroidales bacterium]
MGTKSFKQCHELGNLFEKAVKKYTKTFKSVSLNEDLNGTDLIRKNKYRYQVKCDQTIPLYKNLYFEIFEKTPGYEAGKWRKSPMNADYYILGYFVNIDKNHKPKNDHIVLYVVSMKELERIRNNYVMKVIKPTSKGFLIPVNQIKHKRFEFPKKKQKTKKKLKPLF